MFPVSKKELDKKIVEIVEKEGKIKATDLWNKLRNLGLIHFKSPSGLGRYLRSRMIMRNCLKRVKERKHKERISYYLPIERIRI